MKIENISKQLILDSGATHKYFENISLDIVDDFINSIIAPIGSDVSSLLKIIAGIEISSNPNAISTGAIYLPTAPSSFPWLSVSDNIKFGKKDIDKDTIKSLCAIVGLEGYENHFPDNKSIGFRFRISLARSLALNPKIILLDDPFCKMDYQTRMEIYQLLLDVNKKIGTTFLLATTNLSEAVLLSKKIHLLKNKPLELVKSISCDYDEPDISQRLKSPKYTKCLSTVQDIINSSQDHQLFTISI